MITNKLKVKLEPINKSTEFYLLNIDVDGEIQTTLILDKENLRALIQEIDNAII